MVEFPTFTDDARVKDSLRAYRLEITNELSEIFSPLCSKLYCRYNALSEHEKAQMPLVGSIPEIENIDYEIELDRYLFNYDISECLYFCKHIAFSRIVTDRSPEYIVPIKKPGLEYIVPVGEYGDENSINVLSAARYVSGCVYELIRDDCEFAKEDYSYKLDRDTFFSDPLLSMYEGALSIAQAYSVLSATPHESYRDDPVGYYHKLLEDGVIENLSLRLPVGKLAPMARDGVAFKNPVVIDRNGKSKLSQELVSSLMRERKILTTDGKGEGCPVGRKLIELREDTTIAQASGIYVMGKMFGEVFERLSA